MKATAGTIACVILGVFMLAGTLMALGYMFVSLFKIVRHNKKSIKEESHEITEEEKAKIEWEQVKEKARKAWNEIANIEELHMSFYTHYDYLYGSMELCYEISNLPLYLIPYKCSMEKRPWNRPDLNEVISVIIFARDMESIIRYMNCYRYKDSDSSGFEVWSTNYIYDGMIPLQPCQNLIEDIKHAQKAFIIDYTTGWKYRREKREREEAKESEMEK